MEYVKLKNGSLERLWNIPHVSNPTAETMASYAAEHGYKPLIPSETPYGAYRRTEYVDLGDSIAETCEPMELDIAKSMAMDSIQRHKDAEDAATTRLTCSLGWDVEYKPSAVQDACSVILMMQVGIMERTSWTDADNVRHNGLTMEDMKAISLAMAAHKMEIQDKADEARAAVNAAQSVEELESLTI